MSTKQEPRSGWLLDGAPGQPGGDMAEAQVGEAYSTRFVLPNASEEGHGVYTVTAYPLDLAAARRHEVAEADGGEAGYVIEVEHEWLVCTDLKDPGGTEVWSDAATVLHHGESCAMAYSDQTEAEKAARAAAQEVGADDIDWDGRPERGVIHPCEPVPDTQALPAHAGPSMSESGEVTGLASALAYARDTAMSTYDAAVSIEPVLAALAAAGVTGPALKALDSGRERLAAAADDLAQAAQHLAQQVAVADAYRANPDAGTRAFLQG